MPRRCATLLDGKASAYRDIALMNAAAALLIAGQAKDLKDGVAIANKALTDGRAKATLAKLVEVTNRP